MAAPLEWLVKLEAELAARQADIQKFDDFYTGQHPLPFLTKAHESKMRDEFRALLEDSQSNFMGLVVDVVEERLVVNGFELPADAGSDPVDDKDSWAIWQANQLDADSQTSFSEALVKGVSYLSVWKTDADKYPTIAVEDPSQMIVGYVPGSNFRERAAALKVWVDDWTGKRRANVYLPGGIYKFEAPAATGDAGHATTTVAASGVTTRGGAKSTDHLKKTSPWKHLDDEFVPNPFGVVPVVPLRNKPRLLSEGTSEIAGVYRIQNQINGFLFLLALAGYFGAHKQRWAVGLSLHSTEGQLDEPIDVAIDRLIIADNPDAKFGEFAQTDLDGYIRAIEQKVQHIAATTRTPRHYLIEQGQSPSGDAIKSAESGLTKKVQRTQRMFGEPLQEVMRMARQFAGATDAPVDTRVVWASPETRTEAESTDAAIKRYQMRLTPWRQTMQDLGYSQLQIAQMLDDFGGTPPVPTVTDPLEDPELV